MLKIIKQVDFSKHNRCKVSKVLCAFFIIILAFSATAEVRLANIFRNNGVIQRGKPVPVWGLAEPGETVVVTLVGIHGCNVKQRKEAVADKYGKWVVALDALKAGDKFNLGVQGNDSKDASYQMQAGDVWAYIGSYRHRYMRNIPQITTESWKKENKDLFPLLRLYGTAEKNVTPQRREDGKWKGPEAYNIFGFSPGIADHFGIKLCRDKKIPVGIVYAASLYGHWIDEYLPAEAIVNDPVLGKTEDAVKLSYRVGGTDKCKKMNAERIAYMEKYLKQSIKSNAENRMVLHPDYPQCPKWAETKTAMFYNGAIHPLLPLAVKGVIFKDPNGPKPFDAETHDAKVALLVKSFRKWFNDSTLPIFIIQDGAHRSQNTIRFNAKYAAQQKVTQQDKNVIIVVTNDIEVYRKSDDLFLKTIPAKGHRLFQLADRIVYGNKSINSKTPEITGFKRNGNKIVIVLSMPLQTSDGLAPDGFAIKGKGQTVYKPANAELKANTVIVSAPGVNQPEHVNYCYVNRAIKKSPNVIGKNKMPVPAFSTELIGQKGGR